jgi:uncharacterized protein
MPGGALKLRDAGKLADAGAAFEFDLPLSELPGVPAGIGARGDRAAVRLQFAREQGFPLAQVDLRVRLALTCQRCMGPMLLELAVQSSVLVVDSEREAAECPAGWETFLAPEGRLSLVGLVAEELLLAMPIAPRHAPGEACAGFSTPERGEQAPCAIPAPATVRPFAGLRALIEHEGRSADEAAK